MRLINLPLILQISMLICVIHYFSVARFSPDTLIEILSRKYLGTAYKLTTFLGIFYIVGAGTYKILDWMEPWEIQNGEATLRSYFALPISFLGARVVMTIVEMSVTNSIENRVLRKLREQ